MKIPTFFHFLPVAPRTAVRIALVIAATAAGTARGADLPVRLTTNPGQDIHPAWDPAGNTIVYMRSAAASNSGVPYNLYQVRADTPGESICATGPTSGFGLAHSPSWIGGTGLLGIEERCVFHEYLMFDASMAPFTRTVNDGNDAAFTRLLMISGGGGGGRITFSRDGLTALWRWSTSGGSGTQQIRTGPVAAMSAQAASAVGTVLVETYHASEQRLTSAAALSPDGKLAVLSLPWDGPNGSNTNPRDLWLFHVDGPVAPVNLTNEGQTGATSDSPVFMPDGSRILYARTSGVAGETWDLYQIDPAGGNRHQLTDTPYFGESAPTVSADGSRVAFAGTHIAGYEHTEPALPAGETANANIYVMNLVNPGATPKIALFRGARLVSGTSKVTFGTLKVGAAPVARAFTIANEGAADLTDLAISKSGAGAPAFRIGALGTATVPAGESTTFTVAFDPASKGTRHAVIHITSNDDTANPFDVALVGSAYVPAPKITIEQPAGRQLVAGKSTIGFGKINIGRKSATKTFRIRNTGTAKLGQLAIESAGPHAKDFVITKPAKKSLAPGGSTTFKATFQPASKGTRKAVIRINNSDAKQNPFLIRLKGTGR